MTLKNNGDIRGICSSAQEEAVEDPQIVAYVHEEVEALPYVHEEIEALPYVHDATGGKDRRECCKDDQCYAI